MARRRRLALTAPLALAAALTAACGGAPTRGAAPRSAPADPVAAEARAGALALLEALLTSTSHPALDHALADVDRGDPLAVLSAVEPIAADSGLDEAERAGALLVASVAWSDLGLPTVVRARLDEVLSTSSSAARTTAFAVAIAGLAGPPDYWSYLAVRTSLDDVSAALASVHGPDHEGVVRAVAWAFATEGRSDEALATLAGATAEPDTLWLRALLRFSTGEADAARADLEAVASSSSPVADAARLLAAHLRVADADAVRLTVHDSPRFHGDEAIAILRQISASLETFPAGSSASRAALDARITLAFWSGDDDTALALWRGVPDTDRVRLPSAGWYLPRLIVWNELWQDACSAVAAALASVARLEALADGWPEADACLPLADPPADLDDLIGPPLSNFGGSDATGPSLVAWTTEDELAHGALEDRVDRASGAALAALPASFRSSTAGARAAQDVFVASAFANDSCRTEVLGRLWRRIEALNGLAARFEGEGLDAARCAPDAAP